MSIYGIDLGFGNVDVSWNGEHGKYAFPAVVGEPVSNELENEQDKGIVVEYEKKRFYVGDKAILETSNQSFNFDPGKASSLTEKVKFLAGLGICYSQEPDVFSRVVTGLPVNEYKVLKDSLMKEIQGRWHYDIIVDGKKNHIATEVLPVIIPQGAGSYYSAILDEKGKIVDTKLASGRTLSIDNGYKTTNLVTMEGSRFISAKSTTLSLGMSDVHKEVQRRLMVEYQVNKRPAEIDTIVRHRGFVLKREPIPVGRIIMDAVTPVIRSIIEQISYYVGDWREFDNILLSGGGVYLFEDWFREAYGDMVVALEFPEYANAIGYYRYGVFKSKQL